MNLENLNVTELDAQEKSTVDGGLAIIGGIVVGVVVGAAVEIMSDTDCFIDGLMGE